MLLFAIIIAAVCSAFAWRAAQVKRCSAVVVENTGPQPPGQAGQRAALRALVAEIARCPARETFVVYRMDSLIGYIDDTEREGTTYFRGRRRLQDYNVGYGEANEDWTGVTVDSLRRVAASRGAIADFGKYGARRLEL